MKTTFVKHVGFVMLLIMVLSILQPQRAMADFGGGRVWSHNFCLGGEVCTTGDVNGDGKADLITFVRDSRPGIDHAAVYVALSDGTKFGDGTHWNGYFCAGQEVCKVGDVNGDGKADLVTFLQDTKQGE